MTGPRTLTLDQLNRCDEIASQITGIVHCIQATSQTDIVPDDAIPGACWAVTSLLNQMLQIVTGEATQ